MRPHTSRPARTALVTGAASGIGACAAATFASRGTRVAAVDCDTDRLLALARNTPGITAYPCDVADEAAVQATTRCVRDDLGPIDTVFHSAGIIRIGRLLQQPTADIEHVLRVNYLGTVHIAKATVPDMISQGHGRLSVVASIAGWLPMPDVGAYSASKAAILSFCEVLAAECRGTGVTITCACPPAVETPLLDHVRRTHPHAVSAKRGIAPHTVLAAIEHSHAKGRPFAFPGRGTTAVWRARRLAPTLLGRTLESLVKHQAAKRPD
ncbi:SDR family oxidoreductase [Streptomyces sp. NPDC001093]|uniref:SDR family NAD(P)-dependent oxidoreductase n=1 Tax=Streptomyces sp. NPDC001093 TaxID=3154376 RepID=UPI00331DBCF6